VPTASGSNPQWTHDTGNAFVTNADMQDRFDQAPIAARLGVARQTTETLSFHRRAARDIGTRLSQNDFAFSLPSADATALGTVTLPGGTTPLTNGMLKELFRKGVPSIYDTFAVDLALAIRLLQIGSPAVTLESPTFDFHSGEQSLGPPLYHYVGRAWAALRWVLARIPATGGGTLLDRTLSDDERLRSWGRRRGYNAGFAAITATTTRAYLAHAVMGAGAKRNWLFSRRHE
jgi:hypothetical protein